MCNPHYLKNIALNAFESRKAELKGDVKLRIEFYLYGFTFSQNEIVFQFQRLRQQKYAIPSPSSDRQKLERLIKLFFSQSLTQNMWLR